MPRIPLKIILYQTGIKTDQLWNLLIEMKNND